PPLVLLTRHDPLRMIYGVRTQPSHGGLPMPLEEVVTEHFLARYRALLDAEDCAFDELEHAYEDGDRDHFSMDLDAWQRAVARRRARRRPRGGRHDDRPGSRSPPHRAGGPGRVPTPAAGARSAVRPAVAPRRARP